MRRKCKVRWRLTRRCRIKPLHSLEQYPKALGIFIKSPPTHSRQGTFQVVPIYKWMLRSTVFYIEQRFYLDSAKFSVPVELTLSETEPRLETVLSQNLIYLLTLRKRTHLCS
jgi:hypothetical protein